MTNEQKELKRKWIEALRSGKYEQTRLRLRKGENSYCCLGVLCEIGGSGVWERFVEFEHEWYYRLGYQGAENSYVEMPPSQVLNAVGLAQAEADSLAFANDSGETFEQIADRIEQNNYEVNRDY